MAQQPAVLQTSWLRVEGPKDAQTCPWCHRWVGRLVPEEMRAEFTSYHHADHGCRCTFVPEQLKADPEDPDCAWA